MLLPRISIVIPVYNGHDFLREAIDSALAQTYLNKEVVVVNDGSIDQGRTEAIALSYGDEIRYFSKPNGGVASALNMAVEKMSGEYFSWLSHDDLYSPDKLDREVEALQRFGSPDAVIYSDYAVFTKDPSAAQAVRLPGVPPAHFRYWLTVENRLHGCTLLIPRSAFDQVGGFDASLRTTQDYDLWFRMASTFPFVHIPLVLVKARSHADQGSHKMADVALAECNALLSRFTCGLSPEEIVAATGKSLGIAYADIAESMYRRGFRDAGMVAEKLASELAVPSSPVTPPKQFRKVNRLRNRIYDLGRRVLPRRVKVFLKASMPSLVVSYPGNPVGAPSLENKFTEVYEKNIFGGRISRSGEGSDLVQTAVIRREFPRIIRDYRVETLFDAPCGDWHWMKATSLDVKHYIGADIVAPLIERNRQRFGDSTHDFLCLNLASDPLPRSDLIFCRDCLVHLSFDDARRILSNFKRSGSRYLLTTTFTERSVNNNLEGADSFWRPLNLCKAPFNFPDPVLLINEGCTEEAGQFSDKCMGLWVMADLPVEIGLEPR